MPVLSKSAPTYGTKRLYKDTDGIKVVDFAESFLHISKGIRAGQPFIPVGWQVDLLHNVYERRPDGKYRYRRVVVGVAKKNGKSLLGATVALYGLVEGEAGAEVYSAAGDREQAKIVLNEAKWQVEHSQELSGICKIYRNAITVPSTGAIYRALSADAALQEGLNPSTVVFDELHVQPNAELWDVLTLGSGTRVNPLVFAITTAGYDLTTICGKQYLYGKRVVAGEIEDNSFGFWWWEAPDNCKTDDRDAWEKANPNIVEGLLDLEDMDTAQKQTDEISFRRRKLNQWVRTSGDSWLPANAFNLCKSTRQINPELPVYVGIDMALKHDSIAVVHAQLQSDGVVVVRAKIWHPDDAKLEVALVEQYLRELRLALICEEFAYDPAYFQRSAEILIDDGLNMVEFPQSSARMVPACGHAFELIVNQRLAHDGSPQFVDQVLSAAQRVGDLGWRLSKGKSKRKIDACIAMVIALDRATQSDNLSSAAEVVDVWSEDDEDEGDDTQ